MGTNLNLDTIYSILGNPHKRRIILFLGEKGKAGFTELRRELKMSVGNLYYNLDGLSSLIEKDERRKYYLNDLGKRIYKLLKEEEIRIESLTRENHTVKFFLEKYFLPILIPIDILSALYNQRKLCIFLLSILLTGGAILSLIGKNVLVLLEVIEKNQDPLMHLLFFLASWLGVISLLDIEARIIGGKGKNLEFITSTTLSLIPIYVFQASYLVAIDILGPLGLSILFRVLQVISLGMLTATLFIYQRIPLDRAFIAVFGLYYISYMLGIIVLRLI